MFRFQFLRYGPLQRLGRDAGGVGHRLGLSVGFRRRRGAHVAAVGSERGTEKAESWSWTKTKDTVEALHEGMGQDRILITKTVRLSNKSKVPKASGMM